MNHRLHFLNETRSELRNDPVYLAKLDLVKEKTILNYKKEIKKIRNFYSEEQISGLNGLENKISVVERNLKNNNNQYNKDVINHIFQKQKFEDLGRWL